MPSRRIIESWLKSITPYPYTPAELIERLMNLGIEVESVENRFETLAGFVVGEVLTREKHPNADKLSVCTVTTGGETVTVVCGAPNVAAGQKIAFAPVGAHIPTAGFTIERRKIRGVESQGMICSEAELGLSENHDGIMVLSEDAPVGALLTDVLGDVVYDVDITPNRADCLSHLGVAREVRALTGGGLFLPVPELEESAEPASSAVEIVIHDAELCPRYTARVVRGVKISPSPAWLQETLRKLGLRPRNNVVDATSYVLFECGHPLHAFDLAKVVGGRIEVKTMQGGEKFVTLDGKERELPARALMICDAEKPVAIAGVMGGENSEIGDDTVDVLIESAWFDPSSIRRTAKKLGLSTDASYRFERGADINITEYAVNRAAALIQELAGGVVLAGVVDAYPNVRPELVVELRFRRTNDMLGFDIPDDRQAELLERLGFGVDRPEEGRAMVTVPSYRVDIFAEIDLIEEIARLEGYDRIPIETRATVAFDTSVDPKLRLIEQTRGFFVDNGFTEVVAPYMTDPEAASQYGRPVELRNALGRDFSMLRTSLAPSLGRIVGMNERYSRPNLRLFEVGKAFREGRPDQGLVPGIVEMEELAVIMTGVAEPTSWDLPERRSDLHDLHGIMDRYLARIGATGVELRPVDTAMWGLGAPALAAFVGGEEVGRIGPLDGWIRERYEIAGSPVIALFDIDRLIPVSGVQGSYMPPSKFPPVTRDISLLIGSDVPNAAIMATIRSVGADLLSDVKLFDLYEGKGVEEGKKSMAYGLTFTSHERTLDEETIEGAVRAIVGRLESEHGARLRGG